ncbi:hypothetical protein [Parapedobacter tibetensis]|uniref:hypothetical protein n=1 Tax=Parapedobacter tibetensis TaxID=2972951 RepID=UPI00214D4A09|nr:hypothetical protein [Parapedobacter tibetensis]
MAKRIKAIKCPQCGSVENTLLKADYYKCNSCGTEYFLDSDDVNINHNYRYDTLQPASTGGVNRIIFIGVGIVFGLVILINILSSVFSKKSNGKHTTGHIASAAGQMEQYYWYSKSISFFEDTVKKPLFMLVGSQRKRGGGIEEGKVMAVFYDALNNKEVTRTELPANPGSISVRFREFENGKLYFIIDDTKLFQVDKRDKAVAEVSPDTYSNLPELQAGFAKIEFIYNSDGDGFRVMTNEGKQVFYYPIIQKVYTKDDLYKSQRGFDNIPANTPVRTGFAFSSESIFYPDEKIQLVKYQYKIPIGYPKTSPRFSWSRNYGGAGVFTGADPYKKEFISKRNMNDARVLSYEDFTPDRLYFKPEVLDYNEESVLIAFKPTPADDATYSVQLMDAKTGTIRWTYPTEEKYIASGRIVSAGYFVKEFLLGLDGKLKHRFKAPD